jgi:dihydroorotate dehydrogenase electron transfer subunit
VKRERLSVLANEAVGPYTLLRLDRGGLEPGIPGQFFMLTPPGRLLPRPMSLCLAPEGELGFLIDPIGPGTRALCAAQAGEEIVVHGPLGNGFERVAQPLLVGGGIGMAPFPYLSQWLGEPPALLGFRTAWHAEAAALLPRAEVVLEPTYVTEAMRSGYDVLACGPEPMLEAVRKLSPEAQLAWEAPMACGFGACYGCIVDIDGHLARLCIDGPVLSANGTVRKRSANVSAQT